MEKLLDDPDAVPITLSAIAREAGMGMSALYLYFPDIGDLLLAVLRRSADQQGDAFVDCLQVRWPDDQLRERSVAFVRAHFDFWQRHARLMQMRNNFADAGDERLTAYRQETSAPLIALLHQQMWPAAEPPGEGDTESIDCATVLFTGLERVATVLINPNFAANARLEGEDARLTYIVRLARAEARLVEIAIREMRG
ncbi:TetR/AcrR family transcriptional regulator [Sphingomonas natans]|nr:TetR/AcrR family transcriptional regulator [Sphingomonas sp. BIUV-7]